MTRREELWQVIADVRDAFPRIPNDAETDDVVDALLPLVDRLCAEAAAEALNYAAADSPWYSSEHGPVVPVWRLRNRADAALTGRAAVRTETKDVTP